MKVKHILTTDKAYCLDYFETYCIKNGISYVKLENEIHFGDTILFFYERYDLMQMHYNHMLEMLAKKTATEAQMVSRRVPLTRESFPEIEDAPFYEEKEEKEKYSYPQYKEKKYKENTLGYPKRIRKRF